MTIKVVFFDMVGTLARFVPAAEDLLVAAARAQGIPLSQKDARRGFAAAGEWWNRQMGGRPLPKRQGGEWDALYTAFDQRVLREAGLHLEAQLARRLMDAVMEGSGEPRFELYDDVLPALKLLLEQDKMLGVLSNIGQELPAIVEALGLKEHFIWLVSAAAARASKPNPRIFHWALEQAAVPPKDAAHVGDQYETDVLGARGAGLWPILVDRYGLYAHRTDCQRVGSLLEVGQHV